MTKQEREEIECLVSSLERVNEIDEIINSLFDQRKNHQEAINHHKESLGITDKELD